uniref:26S proteasome non-ATPase regulatory subunit 5 n=1 Tax=Acartia pacifica TaxID=335913 RepID=A0A0U2KCU1_ACAPC|nr:26S proteasome non-ATPase regulatory subunit 14 [Acartia pacifica]
MEELGEILKALSLSENKVETMQKIKPAMSQLNRETLSKDLSCIDLVALFDCLNTKNTDQIERTCDILNYILQFLDPFFVLEKYGGILKHSLNNPDVRVPVLVLKQVQRFSQDDDLVRILGSHAIFPHAVKLIDSELTISSQVFTLLYQLAETETGLKLLLSTVPVLRSAMETNLTIKVRILELAVKVGQISQEHLNAITDIGMLAPLVDMLNEEDILVRLSAVDLMTNLACTQQGLRYLEDNNVLATVEIMMKNSKADPFAETIVPGLIKFFGNIARFRPQLVINQHPVFVSTLLETTDSSDSTLCAIAFETIGYIGASLEGKNALHSIGNKFLNSLEKLEQLLCAAHTGTRIRGLNSVASLIRLDKENQTQHFTTLTESWYRHALGHKPMELLHSIVKQPFLELRLAVYQILDAMIRQAWGRKEILRQPGLPELLLDRECERDKPGMDAKYDIIKYLADTVEAEQIVGRDIGRNVYEYAKQGPYFILPRSHVALDEE